MGVDFIRTDEIQAAMVAYLKSKTAITTELPVPTDGSHEIREQQWQGNSFTYPAVRVRMTSNVPTDRNGCKHKFECTIQVFSESPSSLEADRIAGIIANILNARQFSSNSLSFATHIMPSPQTIRQDERTWRSEIMITGTVAG